MVEFLLGQGQADGSIADSSGRLPLAIAIARGHHDAALPLLVSGVRATGMSPMTPQIKRNSSLVSSPGRREHTRKEGPNNR